MFYEVTADIMARLPEKLQNLVEFGAIGDAVNPEIDKLNAAIGLMAANAFIDTVDSDGLKRWEKILGVTSPLTVYKQRIINDPYHFEVANEKDYVKDFVISGTGTAGACLASGTEIEVIKRNMLSQRWNSTAVSGVTITQNLDGTVHLFGTATADVNHKTTSQVKLLPGTYTMSGSPIGASTTTFRWWIMINSVYQVDAGTGKTFTISSESTSSEITIRVNSGVTIDATFKPQIEKGSVVTPFEPYTLTTALTVPTDLLAGDTWNVITGLVTRADSTTEQFAAQTVKTPIGTTNIVVNSLYLPAEIYLVLSEYQATETFQARKNAIKSKLMTKPPINLETLRTIIEAYMGVEVEITIADSVVSVVYRGDTEVVDLAPLYATLYETIPANLLVEIAYKYLQWLELDAQLLDFDALDAKNLTWDDFERGEWIG